MKQKLIKILKIIASDARQAYIPAILLFAVGGTGTVFYFYRKALACTIQLATTPTPLWATISWVLLCCGYIYLRTAKQSAKEIQCFPLVTPNKKYDIKIRLEPLREKILAIVAVNKLPRDSQIAEVAKISEQLATFHLNELKNIGLICSKFSLDEYMVEATAWSVMQDGLKYLHHHELLK